MVRAVFPVRERVAVEFQFAVLFSFLYYCGVVVGRDETRCEVLEVLRGISSRW